MRFRPAVLAATMILLAAGCSSGSRTKTQSNELKRPGEGGATAAASAASPVGSGPGPTSQPAGGAGASAGQPAPATPANSISDVTAVTGAAADTACFAGGCFWCMEASLEQVPGVVAVVSGYTGGTKKNPTYEEVGAGGTGHAESVQVIFDPTRISYARLLNAFWHNVDPLTAGRQFCDAGSQYRSAIFYRNDEQKRLALESKRRIEESGRFRAPIVTEIVPASTFYRAEGYHQDYYRKNPDDYHAYRSGCGRDRRLRELWGNLAGTAE